ncbi:glycosyltransferase [Emticicia sp. CRIBPO]|uniref:glycosyltransferase family 4 protein n=1 Tax=Emticicia sp. CRIBPO TaxID=2683258 RepID=UPI0014135B86|nr:glycosyltransferase family 4 protein [Emticicia sp. CRIBPO]NBA87085.1 glycosyltransferase [Emticicia sp. CRIBPO]
MEKILKRKVIFFHMLNDHSGSPHVLSLIMKGLIKKGYEIELYSSTSETGFLSNITGVKYNEVVYKFSSNKVLTLILFIYAQLRYFFAVLRHRKDVNSKIYINTILPFGAAFGAAFVKKEVIYHVHEKPVTKNLIQNIAITIFKKYSGKSIFVSKYLFDCFDLPTSKKTLVYNSLSPEFTSMARKNKERGRASYNILMICSLRVYKGVLVFLELAKMLKEYSFTLILNADDEEVDSFFHTLEKPQNLQILSTRTNLHPWYRKADLVVNLSLTNEWVETFGLTALEAMTYGIPVIVPPVGGIAEIVDDGVQGFKVDSRDIDQLIGKINLLFKDSSLYNKMSEEAKIKADSFSYDNMIDQIEKVINS